jgi:predicted outer membrane repeat protein
MTLTDCIIEANRADNIGGRIARLGGKTTLKGSTTVRGNQAVQGGGIQAATATPLTIAETCRVTRNTAALGSGGGIFSGFQGAVNLEGANPSPIVVNNCRENCSFRGNVPNCAEPPVFCPP